MKIETIESNRCALRSIGDGECFWAEGSLCMKLDEMDDGKLLVARVDDGAMLRYLPEERVSPVVAKVVVE